MNLNTKKLSIYRLITYFGNRGYMRLIPDKLYLKIFHRAYHSKKLNVKNPKTFNEKIQWLKLYDRKEEYTNMTDKVEARKYVYITTGVKGIDVLGVYKKFEEIDFTELPNKFVIKCSHDSGSTIICEKFVTDYKKVKKIINSKLKKKLLLAY